MWVKEDPDQYPTLALIPTCHKCNTAKIFKVTSAARAIITKTFKGIDIETSCEKCGTQYGVSLTWLQDKFDPDHEKRIQKLQPVVKEVIRQLASGKEVVVIDTS